MDVVSVNTMHSLSTSICHNMYDVVPQYIRFSYVWNCQAENPTDVSNPSPGKTPGHFFAWKNDLD